MSAAVPLKGAVCATLCKPAVQGADIITYRSHDSVFRMILGIVKGTVVATRKMPELVGYKFLLVEPVFGSKKDTIVAGDNIGAGVGEMVLVTTDETTQHGLDHPSPIDAFIVGIVDNPPTLSK